MERDLKPVCEVRQSTMDDLFAFRRAQANAWLETYPNPEHGVSFKWVKNHVDAWWTDKGRRKSQEFFDTVLVDTSQFHRVATVNGEVVGFIHGSTKPDGSKELEGLYIDPKEHRKGIGTALVQAFDVWAAGSEVIVSVAAYNQRAIHFYEKHGFVKIPGSEGFHRDVMPTFKMKRDAKYRGSYET